MEISDVRRWYILWCFRAWSEQSLKRSRSYLMQGCW